jgi:hypothetical protein
VSAASIRRPPTWVLGALVALLTWRIGMNPPGPGLDASWTAGLAMAAKQGLQFGEEVVFTYGPLGFLSGQSIWFSDLSVLAFLYSAALYLAFCLTLVWALRRVLPPLAAFLIAFFLVAILILPEQAVVVGALVCLGMLERQRSERAIVALAVGGASFSAVEVLVKLSNGPAIAGLFLIALIGLRARWWQLLLFLAVFCAEAAGLWLMAGQSLAAVPAFAESSWQVISGYSTAMIAHSDVPAWQVTAAVAAAALVTVGLVAASTMGTYRDSRARWAGVALVALAAFAIYKEGVVRTDAGHLSLYFSTACVLWIGIPWAKSRWYWMAAGAAIIAAIGVPVRPTGSTTNLDVVANVRFASDQLRSLFSPSRRGEIAASGRAGMKSIYRLDPRTLAALRGHTVEVEPWEIGVAWAYRLEWRPLPVFQNYSAYTPKLDALNSAALESATGPDRILRENEPLVLPQFPGIDLDDRLLAWDPPEQARAALCNFVPLRTTERWQVLGRVADRCSQPRFIRSAEATAGHAVDVPAPGRGEVVFVRIHGAGVEGIERLTNFLLHARIRHVIVNGTETFRLLPETAGDGLLLSGEKRVVGSGAFAQAPQARSLAVTGASGTLRFDFFRMRVEEPRRRTRQRR